MQLKRRMSVVYTIPVLIILLIQCRCPLIDSRCIYAKDDSTCVIMNIHFTFMRHNFRQIYTKWTFYKTESGDGYSWLCLWSWLNDRDKEYDARNEEQKLVTNNYGNAKTFIICCQQIKYSSAFQGVLAWFLLLVFHTTFHTDMQLKMIYPITYQLRLARFSILIQYSVSVSFDWDFKPRSRI